MGAPTSALGITLGREITPGSGTYNPVGQIGDVGGMDQGTDRVEITNHDAATAGRRRIFLATVGKEANLSFPLFYDSSDAEHLGMQQDGRTGTLRGYELTFTDGGAQILTFDAHTTGFEQTAAVEGANQANVTLGISGDIVPT